MAGDKVHPGQEFTPPRAPTWNALVDMLQDFRRLKQQLEHERRREQPVPPNCVKVKNSTGGQLRLGEIVELQTKLLTDVARHFPWFDANVPDETKPFAICIEPIPAGQIGLAQIAGRCPALINVQATTDLWAFVESGQDRLKSDRFWGDVRLLYPPPATGELLMWVSIEKSPQVWAGKTDASHAADGSGTISIWSGTPGSETDTTYNITSVFNKWGSDLASGTWVKVERIHRKPYITLAKCVVA